MQLGEARLDAKVTVHHINITRHRFTTETVRRFPWNVLAQWLLAVISGAYAHSGLKHKTRDFLQ